MDGWNGNLPPISPQAVGPQLTTPTPLHRRCKTPKPLRLCVPKKTVCKEHLFVRNDIRRHFFNTDGTEISELPSGTF